MEVDRNGLQVLSRVQCLALLTRASVGRVVVTDRALPAAFPVNFALLEEDVVFLTSPGSKLEAAAVEAVVAFEVDEIDAIDRSGWSVLVQGPARLIVDPDEVTIAGALGLEPWAPVGPAHFVRIRSELVSGRRLLPRERGEAMTSSSARVDWFAGCPNCGSDELLPVTAGRIRNFVCRTCAACWHIDGGRLRRVDPAACPGCPFKCSCTAAAARDAVLSTLDSE